MKNKADLIDLERLYDVKSDKIDLNTKTGSSGSHVNYLFNELERLLETVNGTSAKKSFVTDTLHEIAESLHRRSMVIIFSDMMDNSAKSEELFSALQHLKHNKHEVVLFHVVDRSKEMLFEYDNRPYTFTDLESGEEIKVNPGDIRETYIKNIEAFKTDLKLEMISEIRFLFKTNSLTSLQ
jgi:hypothetical protein